MTALRSDRMLVVDDDPVFCEVLAEALSKRGIEAYVAHDPKTAIAMLEQHHPERAVLDLRLAEYSGLDAIRQCLAVSPGLKIVVLTGFASVATAVRAMKLGAMHYLTKPANADQILAAFDDPAGESDVELPQAPTRLDQLEWEHIQRVLEQYGGNISATAKHLGLHRRTLQRKLAKRPSGL